MPERGAEHRACVKQAAAALEGAVLDGVVVVVDNGSTDGSAELAAAAGARVVQSRAVATAARS